MRWMDPDSKRQAARVSQQARRTQPGRANGINSGPPEPWRVLGVLLAGGGVRHAIIIVAIRKPCFPVFPVSQCKVDVG